MVVCYILISLLISTVVIFTCKSNTTTITLFLVSPLCYSTKSTVIVANSIYKKVNSLKKLPSIRESPHLISFSNDTESLWILVRLLS